MKGSVMAAGVAKRRALLFGRRTYLRRSRDPRQRSPDRIADEAEPRWWIHTRRRS